MYKYTHQTSIVILIILNKLFFITNHVNDICIHIGTRNKVCFYDIINIVHLLLT